MGRIGTQSITTPALFKPPWPMYLSLSMPWSSYGGRCDGRVDGRVKCSSSIWKRSTMNVNPSGEAERKEELWKEYFADPSQWWDNRADKRNPKSPDFKHKVTREVLWVDGWSTPPWVKAMLKLVIGDKLQPHVEGSSTRNLRQIEGGSDVSMYMHNASTGSEAIAILKNHLKQGKIVGSKMYVDVLQRCFKQGDLVLAKQVHDCMRKSGMEQKIYVVNNLMRVYIRCGRLQDARDAFDKLVKKNVFSWNFMIEGYAKHDHYEDAMEVFNQMLEEGGKPNEYTYSSILKAFGNPRALEWGKVVHAHIKHGGFESDVHVGTALLQMYAKSGNIEDARLVFERMLDRNVFTWTVMIGGLAEHGRGHEAFGFFLQMQKQGIVPNECTYVSILNPCASVGALEWVKEVDNHVLKAGYGANLRVGNALIHMYAKIGSIEDAQLVFDRMVDRDVITWTKMIGGLAEHGRGYEAFDFFLQMQRQGIAPDECTYLCILNACASMGGLEWVKEVHNHALQAGYGANLRVGNALIHMYSKSGNIEDAQLVFERMVDRDIITWTAMIGGLAEHGLGHEALQLFGKMNLKGVKPNGWTFVVVLSACSHAGLVDEGRCQFLAMIQDYGIDPTIEHYNCMVDLLGRAGHLEEAYVLIRDMPLEPNAVTWRALLGACRTHGNVELGELAFKESLKLDPMDAPTYVLLSNIYAAASKWDEVSLVRTMMQERGICKEPGRSWIEIDDKIHSFVVGDACHPEAKEIYAELKRLMIMLKAKGYIPDTRFVLHNIDEEDKKLALCSHSEKLAIAYGLLRMPHGKPIRIYKNLRVCSDCHTATKLISKVTRREIVARDANRFHHFKDGMCSCGDYW